MWDCAKKFLIGFCSESSIHGVKYLVKDKNTVSRCYWCLMLMLSVYCCAQFTLMLSSRFLDIPIRMTIKNKQALTEELLLPAITFCTEIPSTNEWYEKFLDNITLPHGYSRDSVLDAMRYAISDMSPRFQMYPKQLNTTLLTMPRDFMSQVSVPCDVLLSRCQLRGQVLPCGDIFTRVRGQCCRFIDNDEDFRSSGQVSGNNLKVVTTFDHGFAYFMVHKADSEPMIDQSFYLMGNGYYVMFYIDPTQILKSEEVHEIEEENGECVHPDELSLRYFEEYNFFNCAAELAINTSLALCDCVPTYYPVPDEITCNFTNMNCIQKYNVINKRIFSHSRAGTEKYILDPAKRKGINIWEKCLESCEYMSYKFSFKPRDLFPFYEYSGFLNDMDIKNEYVIQFNYESQFYTVQEFVLICDWITLLSNLGGVFGLFLGYSMITLAEIIFYLWRSIEVSCETQTVQRLH
ncbi:sodium channel protein Nach-like isoform X2 [Choristoneura fumiferana]|uniref:sodium channel protein Nach-like isoform X2 n=1 Tax=Choristoneura fumiferana TaxID=7141 RepID=UPI003D153D03